MTSATRVVAISAGLSVPSSTSMLARRLGEATGADVELIELRALATDLTNMLLTHVASPRLSAALDAVARADAVIAVTPVFNASYSGLFKMFFEVLDEGALAGTPVLLGATGGTARHSLAIQQAMVPLFFYLKADVVPTTVFAATDDWGSAGLDARIADAATDLMSVERSRHPASVEPNRHPPSVERSRNQRARNQHSRTHTVRTVDDDFELVADFEDMLRAI